MSGGRGSEFGSADDLEAALTALRSAVEVATVSDPAARAEFLNNLGLGC